MTRFLARICAQRPLTAMAVGVVVLVIAGFVGVNLLDSATTTDFRLAGRYESERAAALLEERLQRPEQLAEIVIVQSPSLTVADPAFRAKVEEIHGRIMALGPGTIEGGLQNGPLHHYYQVIEAGGAIAPEERIKLLFLMASQDGGTALLHYSLAGNVDEATVNVEDVMLIVEEANGVDGFRVLIGGTASIIVDQNNLAAHDLEQGERFGIPVALLVLLLLFGGGVVATLLPPGQAGVAIVVALAAVALIGQAFELIFFVQMMVVMIGLAVGIDYSLLIVSRFKEEMGRGLSPRAAVERAGETAGRTVLFSGATVVLALVGLLIVPASFHQSLALGAILVVLAALASTLTLLPAALSFLGPRVNDLTIPFLGRFALKDAETAKGGFWDIITHAVMRRPVVSIILVAAPMLFLSYFTFEMQTGLNDVNTFPDEAETKEAFVLLEEKFAVGDVGPNGLLNPAEIVIAGDVNDSRVAGAIERLEQALVDDPTYPVPPEREVNDAGDLALLTLRLPGESTSPASADEMHRLREEIIPAAFDGVPTDLYEVYVGGLTAEATDFYGIVDVYTPIVFVFVLGLSFVILMMVFRSIVIPLKAIIMNLLSVGATYGLLVLVFQKGFATDLLGFQRAEVIDAWLPLFLFAVLFGLSMDYHVFLLSRIRERYDETRDNTEAVAYGLRSTAGLITGAALIMVVVFGAFATGDLIINQLLGFGLAIAVLLDATLVRSVLVPASMEVLGGRNWYLPRFLRWLPDLRVEPTEERPSEGEAPPS